MSTTDPRTRWNVHRLYLDDDHSKTPQRWMAGGHTLHVVDASSPLASASVALDDKSNGALPLAKGMGWKHGPFEGLYFTHDAQAGEWLDIFIAGNPKVADPASFSLQDQKKNDGLGDTWINALHVAGADGGEKIQNAIDLLSDKGGVVYIPPTGPDNDVPLIGKSNRDGVWAINSQITVPTSHIRIEGSAAGAYNEARGTQLIWNGGDFAGPMIKWTSRFNSIIAHLYLDANEDADRCIQATDDGEQKYDKLIYKCNIQHGRKTGVHVTGRQRFVWIQECFFERNQARAIGVATSEPEEQLWVTNCNFDKNETDILFGGQQTYRECFIANNVHGRTAESVIEVFDNASLFETMIIGIRAVNYGNKGDGAFLKAQAGARVSAQIGLCFIASSNSGSHTVEMVNSTTQWVAGSIDQVFSNVQSTKFVNVPSSAIGNLT
jgi:hypothetical protein